MKKAIYSQIVLLFLSCNDQSTAPDGDIELGPDDLGAMVEVPAGDFMRGCNETVDNKCSEDEYPYTSIYLSAFMIDKYEITTGQYEGCIKAGPCENREEAPPFYLSNKNHLECNLYAKKKEYDPMQCVSWYGAKAYCEWVGKRLPTEAEWEKAARGTDGRKYPWGNTPYISCDYANVHSSGYVQGDETVITKGCGIEGTIPVGKKPKGMSPYGAHDMLGNVAEWVNDKYDYEYYQTAATIDPAGPDVCNPFSDGVDYRVIRGANWGSILFDMRASNRRSSISEEGSFVDGFRCAKEPHSFSKISN